MRCYMIKKGMLLPNATKKRCRGHTFLTVFPFLVPLFLPFVLPRLLSSLLEGMIGASPKTGLKMFRDQDQPKLPGFMAV